MTLRTHKKEFNIILVSVLLGALAAAGFGFFYNTIQAKVDRIAGLQDELALVSARVSRLSQLTELVRTIEEERTQLASYYLSEDDIVDYLEMTEDIAARTETVISFSSIEPVAMMIEDGHHKQVAADTDNAYPIYKLNLAVDGAWGDMMEALQLLETAPVMTMIHSIRLDNIEGDEEAGNTESFWKASLEMTVGRSE